MSLVYRAIWQDSAPNLFDKGFEAFQDWIDYKRLDLVVPEEGQVKHQSERQYSSVTVVQVSDDEVQAVRMRLDEERQASGVSERWSTIALWMTDGTTGWIWVDVEWVSDNISAAQPQFSAPNLVSKVLKSRIPDDPQNYLGPNPRKVSKNRVEELVSWLYSEKRQTPLVVFSVDVQIDAKAYSRRARETARRLTGCVDVRMLTSDSQGLFHEIMEPSSLSVFRGAARIYLPGLDPEDPQPWRHRFLQARTLTDNPNRAASLISQRILPRMVSQRPPLLYRERVRSLLTHKRQKDWQEIALDLDKQNLELEETIAQQQVKIAAIELDREIAWEDALESDRASERTQRKLEALRHKLRVSGEAPEVIENEVEDVELPTSCREAIEAAVHLDNVVIHPKAVKDKDLDRMDEKPNSQLWGRRILRFLKSLNTYASQKDKSRNWGFKEWCENSGDARVIPPKLVATSESDWVKQTRSLRNRRNLPVDPSVDASGYIEMLSHLKPIEGGGACIPRIYYYDDSAGPTGKIHVGFIGPHDLMPNKTTSSM
ncbi:MAG: hypothetical protein OXD37_03425 [Acidimicrobiaceae bacterium]|nr:hypothetical protein [Acidimicrobiaceae bacterium]